MGMPLVVRILDYFGIGGGPHSPSRWPRGYPGDPHEDMKLDQGGLLTTTTVFFYRGRWGPLAQCWRPKLQGFSWERMCTFSRFPHNYIARVCDTPDFYLEEPSGCRNTPAMKCYEAVSPLLHVVPTCADMWVPDLLFLLNPPLHELTFA